MRGCLRGGAFYVEVNDAYTKAVSCSDIDFLDLRRILENAKPDVSEITQLCVVYLPADLLTVTNQKPIDQQLLEKNWFLMPEKPGNDAKEEIITLRQQKSLLRLFEGVVKSQTFGNVWDIQRLKNLVNKKLTSENLPLWSEQSSLADFGCPSAHSNKADTEPTREDIAYLGLLHNGCVKMGFLEGANAIDAKM